MNDYLLDNGLVSVRVPADGSLLTVESRVSPFKYEAADYAAFTYGGQYFFNLPAHATPQVSQDGEAIRIAFDHIDYWARFPENGFCKPKNGPELRFEFSIRLKGGDVCFSIDRVQGMDSEALQVFFPYKPLRWRQQDAVSLAMTGGFSYGNLLQFPGQPRNHWSYNSETLPLYGIMRQDGGMGVFYCEPWDQSTEYDITADACCAGTAFTFIRGLVEYPRNLHLFFLAKGENYVQLAKHYRSFREKEGRLPFLSRKIEDNPEVGRLLGSVIWKHNVYWKDRLPEGVSHDYSLYVSDKVSGDYEGRVNNWTAKEVFDTAKASGFDRVCVLNTGWNHYGFDSGYPTRFPVNAERGTEEEFKAWADYARSLSPGYILSVHDNYRDCYPVSPEFDMEEMYHGEDNAPLRGGIWYGGRCYLMCPQVALKYARRDLPRIAALSGRGCIYIDVLGCAGFSPCRHPSHPGSGRDDALARIAIIKEAKMHFGAVATESTPSDYCVEHIDLGAYACIKRMPADVPCLEIPLWQLVYHGGILNYSADGHAGVAGSTLKNYQALYGLLPSGFSQDSLRISRELRQTYLAEMLSHEVLDETHQRTVFSDGTVVTADFSVQDGKGHFDIRH